MRLTGGATVSTAVEAAGFNSMCDWRCAAPAGWAGVGGMAGHACSPLTWSASHNLLLLRCFHLGRLLVAVFNTLVLFGQAKPRVRVPPLLQEAAVPARLPMWHAPRPACSVPVCPPLGQTLLLKGVIPLGFPPLLAGSRQAADCADGVPHRPADPGRRHFPGQPATPQARAGAPLCAAHAGPAAGTCTAAS